ncbi:MAG: hypothetical protein CMD22_03020 [Flavobacteriales bacterium]|nr:hypothetical protein [Flavobacteriales bacterium]
MAFPFSRKKKSLESPSKKKLKMGQAVKLVTPKKSKKPKRTVTWANTKGGNLEKVKQYNKNTKLTSEIKKSNNEKNTKTENNKISKSLHFAEFRAKKITEQAKKNKQERNINAMLREFNETSSKNLFGSYGLENY